MPRKSKSQCIREIPDEKTFREDVLKILLNKMGYQQVTVTHGPNEQGKDLVFFEIDSKTGDERAYAIVAKIGGIKGGSNKDTENIINIQNQIRLALEVPWDDPIRKKPIYIDRVWVANNGPISNAASKQIVSLFGEEMGAASRNVKFVSETVLLEMLNKHWQSFFLEQEPFLVDYFEKIKSSFETLNELKSFGYSREIKSLVDIFIEPILIKDKKPKVSSKGKSTNVEKPFEEMSLSTALKNKDKVWIMGQPGSGKSTTLRNALLKIIEKSNKNLMYDFIPVFFRFTDMIQGEGSCRSLENMIVDHFEEFNTAGYNIEPQKWLTEGKLIIFMDGLDEIPASHDKDICIEEIKEFMGRYKSIKVVCTSRDIGFSKIKPKIGGFEVLEIQPFSFSQMKNFVQKWFKDNKNAGDTMMGAIKTALMSGHLPKTPMVLTLLAVLLEEQTYQELPANLTDLYTMFTELFLGKWDVQRDVQHMFDYNIKRNVLMEIAYSMHMSEKDYMLTDDLIAKINEYDKERRVGLSSDLILKEIEERSGLLMRLDDKIYFKHFSFQEFFTAQKWGILPGVENGIAENFLDSWWQNVIFFYVGNKKDAPQIIEDVMKNTKTQNSHESFTKMINIGQLLQAAYLSNHDLKVTSIKSVLKEYYTTFEQIWSEIEKEDDRTISKLMLLFIFEYVFGENYASMTLKDAVEEVFNAYWDDSKIPDQESLMICYFTAYTLALLEFTDKFEELATSPNINDPLYLPMLDLDMRFLKSEYSAKFDQKSINKVKKRISHNLKQIRQYSN